MECSMSTGSLGGSTVRSHYPLNYKHYAVEAPPLRRTSVAPLLSEHWKITLSFYFSYQLWAYVRAGQSWGHIEEAWFCTISAHDCLGTAKQSCAFSISPAGCFSQLGGEQSQGSQALSEQPNRLLRPTMTLLLCR